MVKCIIESCLSKVRTRGYCNKHYLKWWKFGNPHAGRGYRDRGTGSLKPGGYIDRTVNGSRRLEHVRIAESVLGRRLPKGSVVHHANGDATDNSKANLVICPNNGYHRHLHRRLNAWKTTGNPNLLKCTVCHQYDDKENLIVRHRRGYKMEAQHRLCKRTAEKRRRQNRNQRAAIQPSI